jgi:NhaP-type Na+/H+ or K+/H+ antiporter
VPDVLYLILIGVILGPVLQVVSPQDFGKVGNIFTAIALVVILFEGGLELSFDQLRKSLRGTVLVTVVSYLLAFGAVYAGALWLMGLPPMLAAYMAAVLAAPAPTVMIPLARQLPLSQSSKTMLTLESPLGEAIGIVVALAVFQSLGLDAPHMGTIAGRLVASFIFALVIGGLGGFIWSVLLHRIRQLRFAIFTTPAFLLVLFGLTEFLGFSGPVSALTFGVVLANAGAQAMPWLSTRYNITPLQHNEIEKSFFGEIVFLIKTFFFVYLGLSVRLTDWWTTSTALSLAAGLVLARIVTIRLATRKNETPREDALRLSMMIPKGTAAAVLASLPLQQGIPGGEQIQGVVYEVIVVSIIVTAVLLFLVAKTPFAWALRWMFSGYRAPDAPEPDRRVGTVAEEIV